MSLYAFLHLAYSNSPEYNNTVLRVLRVERVKNKSTNEVRKVRSGIAGSMGTVLAGSDLSRVELPVPQPFYWLITDQPYQTQD